MSTVEPWWGEVEVSEHSSLRWQVGPFELVVARGRRLWRVGWRHTDEDSTHTGRQEVGPDALDACLETRAVATGDEGTLRIDPILAPRAVVARTDPSCTVLPSASQQWFVETAIWVRVQAGALLLAELPTMPPLPTWYGPNTIEGELCWEGRSLLRESIDLIPGQPHRAVTPIQVDNPTAQPIDVSRIRVPTPRLSLHVDGEGRLWTPRITLTHGVDDTGDQMSSTSIDSTKPPQSRQVAPPHHTTAPRDFVQRATAAMLA